MRVSRFEQRFTTPDQLLKFVHYDREEGALYWLHRHGLSSALVGKRCGSVNRDGYRLFRIKSVGYSYEHRIIWFLETSAWPNTIDHINGDVSNSRFTNLRNVTQTANTRNAALNKNNKTGITGVRRKHNHWYARIMVDRKDIHLYSGDSLEDAIRARKEAEARYGFHPNHGRPAIASGH